MDNVKLYLNMILKEDEPIALVKRSIDSVKDYVDGMYITVTYSDVQPETSSPLEQLLQEYEANVSYFKWIDDFSAARQYALDQVPHGDHSYIYWQDADDILQGAEHLPQILKDTDRLHWDGVFFTYWYRVALDAEENVREILIEQKRERIIRNNGTYTWRGMLHETLIGQRLENFTQYLREECTVIHLTTEERVDKALERNIHVLEGQLEKEQHRDPRTLVYLAKSYYDKGISFLQANKEKEGYEWHQKALELFTEYLHGKGDVGSKEYIEQSGWDEERASALQYMSQIYILRGQFPLALTAINDALDAAPQFPIYYIDKAVIYTHLKDFKKAKHWLTVATSIEMPKTTLMLSPRDLKVRALECDAHIAMNDHDLKRVGQDYRALLVIDPESENYKQNVMVAESLEAANKASTSIVYLGKYLTKIGEEEKILPLLQAVPKDLTKEPFYSQMRHKHIPPRLWETNEIAILCGPGFEQWSPKSIEKGLGGSEEAVVYLSEALTKQGWKVTVYANPEAEEGEYNGVYYENYYKLNPEDLFNHLVIWRGIGFADIKPKARGKILLWMHDMPNIPDFTEERLKVIDTIAVLSEFHKAQIKQFNPIGEPIRIPESKFLVTRNGIPDLDIHDWKGNPHRMCYVSSPDRGLIYLLKSWKIIREQVSDAELHIYYGFEMYDFIHRNNPARMAFKKRIMELMEQEGIVFHGRVGHKELAQEMNKCGVWVYPTDFTEISCISAMKAQATGAVPVVTDYAALKETVRNGVKVDIDIQEKDGQKIFFEALIDLLQHPEKQEELRNLAWAQEYFSWDRVASQWSDYFGGNKRIVNMMKTPGEWQKTLEK